MLGTDPKGDSCFDDVYHNNGTKTHFVFKVTIQCKPFFLFLAIFYSLTFALKSTNAVLDIASYRSQSGLVNTKTAF